MKLAYSQEKKMFKGRINNIDIWTRDLHKAIWYEDCRRINKCRMLTYDEAKEVMD